MTNCLSNYKIIQDRLINKRHIKKITTLLLILCLLIVMLPYSKAEAATKKYGIVIADQNGKYTFYDWNESVNESGLEISSNGNVMVPLERLSKSIPNLKYSFDSKLKKATVKNTVTGKKVVFTENSKNCYYYSSSKASGVKKPMTYKMYVSSNNASVMIHMSAIKWVMGTTAGYHYYKPADMQTVGYDTAVYSGLIVYNPYGKVTTIPKATNVTGISQTVKVTIPEGYSVAQIFNLLVKKGVCASSDLLYDALNNYDYSYYPLVNKIVENDNRSFRLEGYLFPDTYEFYRLSKAEDIIGKFLRNTEAKITDEDIIKADELGYTMDEILTIASMIEKETGDPKQMLDIASVIYNRLNKPMKLQLDCSINYIEKYVKPYIEGDIDRYNSYYNTYKCSALPAGPICNPGVEAIHAALNPSETDNLYFYSDPEGNYYFTATYEEILAIQAKFSETLQNEEVED